MLRRNCLLFLSTADFIFQNGHKDNEEYKVELKALTTGTHTLSARTTAAKTSAVLSDTEEKTPKQNRTVRK
jgi:hypothetical protein